MIQKKVGDLKMITDFMKYVCGWIVAVVEWMEWDGKEEVNFHNYVNLKIFKDIIF